MIEVLGVGKQFVIATDRSYLALRDVISEIMFHPLRWVLGKLSRTNAQTAPFFALEDVTFTVNRGDVLGIVGRNGAGKSTLLKILSRITPPSTGEVRIYGRVSSLLEVGTGFHPELTGRENIFLSGAILGMRKKEIEQKFDSIVSFSGVEKFLNMPVKRYSSGMRVRLAFSVAAFMEPEILLIDEVLSVGDSEFQKKCIRRMKELTEDEGRTIVFVSHDLGVIRNLCNKALLLDKGSLVCSGSVQSVLDAYLLRNKSTAYISLKDRHDRRGNGKLRITGISFRNMDGDLIGGLVSGEDFQIWVDYDVHDTALADIYFAISIIHPFSETDMAYMGNKVTGDQILPGDPIRICVKKLPFNVGLYSFTVIAVDIGDDVLDWVNYAGEVEINPGDFYPSKQLPPIVNGVFLLDYQFVS